jgi:hypothetical protein
MHGLAVGRLVSLHRAQSPPDPGSALKPLGRRFHTFLLARWAYYPPPTQSRTLWTVGERPIRHSSPGSELQMVAPFRIALSQPLS